MRIIHFSDVHLNQSAANNFSYGEYGQDSTPLLFESALSFANETLHQEKDEPTIFLYTGDHTVHHYDTYTLRQVKDVISHNVALMEKYFPPTSNIKWIFSSVLGNTDSSTDYAMPMSDDPNPEFNSFLPIWSNTLSPQEQQDFRDFGYVSHKVKENLVILSINTVQYSPLHDPQHCESIQPDPFNQFAWLEAQLKAASVVQAKVLIVGHVPPILDSYANSPQWRLPYLHRYQRLVAAFHDVIIAQLFGHVHSVEFRVSSHHIHHARINHRMPPVFTTGSISTLFRNNPTYSVWKLNTTAGVLSDWIVYGANLTTERLSPPEWHKLFTASTEYDIPSLTSRNLAALSKRMAQNTTLLQRYMNHMTGDRYNNITTNVCHNEKNADSCQAHVICSQRWVSSGTEYSKCISSQEKNQYFLKTSWTTVLSSAIILLLIIGIVKLSVLKIRRVNRRWRYQQLENSSSFFG